MRVTCGLAATFFGNRSPSDRKPPRPQALKVVGPSLNDLPPLFEEVGAVVSGGNGPLLRVGELGF